MTWTPDKRTELHKTFGPYTMVPERNRDGETAHLVSFDDDGPDIRVLPDGQSSGQKRSRVVSDALVASSSSDLAPDLARILLIGSIARANLEWEEISDGPGSIEDWLTEGLEAGWASARQFLKELDAAGFKIVTKGET